MAIITISRGSYSRGKEVAERVAAELGYGNVLIYTVNDDRMAHRMKGKVEALIREIQGINHIEVHPGVSAPRDSV